MSDPTVSLFLDTNCFIHLRDVADLPWLDIVPGHKHIELVVAPMVIRELDRLKVDSNPRRRNRSRAALEMIETASEGTGLTRTLRSKPTTVTLRISSGPRIDWSLFPNLDPAQADDQLVACAATETTKGERCLVSFDRGPLIRARVIGLKSIRSPETWQLPEQADDESTEAARLKRELEAARATRPTLATSFIDACDDGVIDAIIPELPPLSKGVQDELHWQLETRSPKAEVKATSQYTMSLMTQFTGGISPEQVQQYETQYDRFLQKGRDTIATLHERLEHAMLFAKVSYSVVNESQVTALNLLTSFSTGSRLFVADHKQVARYDALRLPDPPKEPGRGEGRPFNVAHLIAAQPPPHDPTAFYWLERPTDGIRGVLQCAEFRAFQRRTDNFFVMSKENGEAEDTVIFEVSATNLAKPLRIQARLRLQRAQVSWQDHRVLDRLPDWMADVLRKDR